MKGALIFKERRKCIRISFMGLDLIRTEVLADKPYEEIVGGELKPGEKLNEDANVIRFNASGSTVCEALRYL